MAVITGENSVKFDGTTYENEIATLRDYLQEVAPIKVEFDFESAGDIHLAILQVIMSYTKLYESEYKFSKENSIFKKTLQGFETSENHCN
ncbi:MAG: hypothetical protein U9N42_00990 [Campylobacterota bacterium]|nr:hypothetical protein [Campylobacterota bacterium]